MNKLIDLINNYSKENHHTFLYNRITPINFTIHTIKSSKWMDENLNSIPDVPLTHLLDSYSCLPERPDMGFTFIWKSINSCYKDLGTSIILSNKDPKVQRLSDSDGIGYLVGKIYNYKDHKIFDDITISSLIQEYAKIIPIKPLKFLSNKILKGYVIENANFKTLLQGGTYASFKTDHPNLFFNIKQTYCESYKSITSPEIEDIKVNLKVSNLEKSRTISHSLAERLQELLVSGSTTFKNSRNTFTATSSIENEKQLIGFLLKTVLYSIRNNTVHGNIVSRLNSGYVNNESLKSSIYIYFLGHVFFSLALYCNDKILREELKVNLDNLELLKTLL